MFCYLYTLAISYILYDKQYHIQSPFIQCRPSKPKGWTHMDYVILKKWDCVSALQDRDRSHIIEIKEKKYKMVCFSFRELFLLSDPHYILVLNLR